MLIARSNRFGLNNHKEKEEETLARMAKDGTQIEDVEEGEISDSASVEEISAEDFNKQEARVSKESSKPKGEARVWTMRDLYKYPMCRGYATGLYNLAWAQAVQNKPLNEIFVMDVEPDESSMRSSSSSTVTSLANSKEDKNVMTAKEVTKVIIDDSGDEMDVKMEDVGGDEKEEGELEEGEIDLDSEPVEKAAEEGEEMVLNNGLSVSESEIDSKERELEKRVNSIREALESVTLTDAKKSFEGVCLRLQNSLESLQEVVLQNCVPSKEALIQLSYSAIQSVNSVFCSMNHNQKEQNKVIFSRLLSVVMSQDPPHFSPELMKEIEVMMSSLDSPAVLSSTDDSNREKEKPVTDGVNQTDSDALAENAGRELNSSKKFMLDSLNVGSSLDKNDPKMLLEAVKPGLFSLRGRGVLAPLLDLHKDHDADSLPSPTRGTTTFLPVPFLPVHKASAIGDGVAKPESATARVAHEVEDSTMHPYETEALKAVSTYQQKFGRTSFLLKDLPSPTPSEECDDGAGDTSGEVSSSCTVGNVKNVNPPIFARPIVSSAPRVDGSSVQGLISARIAGSVSSGSNPTLKTSAKSRDPRLRLACSDVGALDLNHRPLPVVYNAPKVEPLGGIISSRKHKTVEEPILDGPTLKRQRNGLTNSDVVMDVKPVSGSGGWLEDTATVGPQFMNRNQLIENTGNNPRKMETGVSCPSTASSKPNVTTSGNELVPVTGTSTLAPLPALFKDIAVNPTMLLNLLKMGQQQRLAAEVQQKSDDPAKSTMHPPSLNSILGAVPLGNVAPITPSGLGQKLAGTLQVPSQIAPLNMQDDLGKIRMKPRDPRRILHSNTFQKSGSLGSEQFKTNGAPTLSTQGNKDNVNAQKPEDQADRKSMPSQSVAPPDIARQFTKNLKNIADILSLPPQPSMTPPVASQILSSQQVQVNSDKVDVKSVISDSDERQTGIVSTPEEGLAGTSRPQNSWGDVEHLFEGFDDQQKAAIQRERSRRIEEQKKMFAARKLCLVLDLDHTLLNSAKFVEVDPAHDEILRKKEEQDREKPQRHLFRFPHMGMWTKLRPGIWNFLEKASNLYELHLYTMGNKLYATEMAKVLDPKGVLFAGRVISRGDDGDISDGDERVPKSKDLEGVLGMESAVVIIDDSVRVWPHNKLNLIVVERYTYFPCSRRQFGLLGPSLLEIDHDERPEDGTLASSLAVIEKIHQDFFSHRALDEVDVRNILALEQRKILGGCRIVFSRVFPVGEANPHLHPLWQTAEQFGAACTNQIDEQVTHVVANSLGTDKVNWALSTGRFVVHPGWVEASALLYRRANEQDFAIKP